MRNLKKLIVLAAALSAGSAFAADEVINNNTNNNYYGSDGAQTSTANQDTVATGMLRDQFFAFKPSAGVIGYVAPNGETQARGALALLADINISRALPESLRTLYFGVTTGGIYSHVGSQTSNFFGTDANAPQNAVSSGANMLIIPANLQLAWQPFENARLGVHGGVNLIYRSVGSAMAMGNSSNTNSDIWRFFPNVGLDFDMGLTRNVSLSIRPDYTITPGQDVVTATVGIGIGLG